MFGLKRFKIRSYYHEIMRPVTDILFEHLQTILINQQFTTSPKDFLVLCELEWKKGVKDHEEKLKDIQERIDLVQDVIIISDDKDRTLCFIKGVYDQRYTDLFLFTTKEFLCFVEYPLLGTAEYGEGFLVGPPKEVNRLMEFMQTWGAEWDVRGVMDYYTRDRGILTVLTEKQLEVMKTAYAQGFFDHPRKKDARDIAYTMGISHATFLTHIRKSQKRILGALLEGG